MEVQLQRVALEDKSILRHLIELYLYDLSALEGLDVDARGRFGYKYLDHYWTEPGRVPFLIRANGHIAGFVLVNQHTCLSPVDGARSIAEFFVLKKYRGRGVGERAATQVFDLFPGGWEVRQMVENVGAQAFWRKVVVRYSAGQFQELFLQDDCWCGPVQVFETDGVPE